jgi:hypothetical protein
MADMRQLHLDLLERDKGCMARKAELALDIPIEQWHACRGRLTTEHVTMVHNIIEGRKSDKAHCVILCLELNGGSMRLAPHWMKEWFRLELRKMYPDWSHDAGS